MIPVQLTPRKRSKYGVRNDAVGKLERTCDGITFASKAEMQRYWDLNLLERAGLIRNLKLQPVYELKVHGERVCKYVADFRYEENGKIVVEDCKGVRTAEYRLKKRLMKIIHKIEIKEV
jgi:Protein of unknown function (DUF1064)